MNTETPEPWDTAKIREAFIYDGGEAEYYDPINGARDQRRYAGETFDRWLAAHDADIRQADRTLLSQVRSEADELRRQGYPAGVLLRLLEHVSPVP